LPTGAEIVTPRSELKTLYETGNGSFKARACTKVEDGESSLHSCRICVGSKVQEQIAAQINAKKLPMVTDIRDESTMSFRRAS